MEFELRKWKASDANSFWEYAHNPKVARNMRASFPSTPEEVKKIVDFFCTADETKVYGRAVSIGGEAVGSIAAFPKDDVYCKSAEIAYWLGEPFWGKGIMGEAIRRVCGVVFQDFDINRIFAEPYACNTGSRRVLEKAGFTLEGTMKKGVYKDGNFFDYCVYAIVK